MSQCLSHLTFVISVCLLSVALSACGGSASRRTDTHVTDVTPAPSAAAETTLTIDDIVIPSDTPFYMGADLSYVNEMDDCGAEFRVNNVPQDAFTIFSEAGANLIRVRLWHNPQWTQYSNLPDVKKTIARAKAEGMQVLLDFHYSDTWADPEKQYIPAAWASLYGDTEALGEALYSYTIEVLAELQAEALLPEMVQVGNETNNEILQPESDMNVASINWPRNAYLLNRGLAAVSDYNQANSQSIKSMLHIAQPENALWWFDAALEAGIGHFDYIGLSYYAKWSTFSVDELGEAIARLQTSTSKKVMIVETAYPWSLKNFDAAGNVLGEDSLVGAYPASPKGQQQYLIDLSYQVASVGGLGVVYWEPAWVSTECSTLWGKGSHWENASFFDAGNSNNALPALNVYSILKR